VKNTSESCRKPSTQTSRLNLYKLQLSSTLLLSTAPGAALTLICSDSLRTSPRLFQSEHGVVLELSTSWKAWAPSSASDWGPAQHEACVYRLLHKTAAQVVALLTEPTPKTTFIKVQPCNMFSVLEKWQQHKSTHITKPSQHTLPESQYSYSSGCTEQSPQLSITSAEESGKRSVSAGHKTVPHPLHVTTPSCTSILKMQTFHVEICNGSSSVWEQLLRLSPHPPTQFC